MMPVGQSKAMRCHLVVKCVTNASEQICNLAPPGGQARNQWDNSSYKLNHVSLAIIAIIAITPTKPWACFLCMLFELKFNPKLIWWKIAALAKNQLGNGFEDCGWRRRVTQQVFDQWVKVGPWDPGGIFPILPSTFILPPINTLTSWFSPSHYLSDQYGSLLWRNPFDFSFISKCGRPPPVGRMINCISSNCSSSKWSHLFWDSTIYLAEQGNKIDLNILSISYFCAHSLILYLMARDSIDVFRVVVKRRYLFPIKTPICCFCVPATLKHFPICLRELAS